MSFFSYFQGFFYVFSFQKFNRVLAGISLGLSCLWFMQLLELVHLHFLPIWGNFQPLFPLVFFYPTVFPSPFRIQMTQILALFFIVPQVPEALFCGLPPLPPPGLFSLCRSHWVISSILFFQFTDSFFSPVQLNLSTAEPSTELFIFIILFFQWQNFHLNLLYILSSISLLRLSTSSFVSSIFTIAY